MKPKRVLVVDDEPTIRELVSELLTDFDFDVDTAANGAEALSKVERHRPDAVLLDLMMPVMDGWTFLEHCRQDPSYAGLPIVVMSAAPKSVEDAARLGAQACVPKPFDVDVLASTVERVVGQSTAQAA